MYIFILYYIIYILYIYIYIYTYKVYVSYTKATKPGDTTTCLGAAGSPAAGAADSPEGAGNLPGDGKEIMEVCGYLHKLYPSMYSIHTYIHIFIYVYIYTYIHIYTHMFIYDVFTHMFIYDVLSENMISKHLMVDQMVVVFLL